MRTSILNILMVAVLFLLPIVNSGKTPSRANASLGFALSINGNMNKTGIPWFALDRDMDTSGKLNDAMDEPVTGMLINGTPAVFASSTSGNPADVAAIYPNPFTVDLSIDIPEEWLKNKSEFRIYTLLGVEVRKISLIKQSTTIETGNLPSGIYFYKIISNNKAVQSGRLVSQQ